MRFQCYRTARNFFYWRFLSRNHRIVALGPHGYSEAVQAQNAARLVRDRAAVADIELASERGSAWRWMMRIDAEAVAVSAHTYGRRIEALAAARRFRLGAADARIEERIPLLGGDGGTPGHRRRA